LVIGAIVLSAVSACGGGDGANSFTIGGTIAGLTASGLMLNDGTSAVSPAANATSFTFPAHEPTGTRYSVTIGTQPAGQQCSISNGSGSISSANIANVQVTCTSLYSVGGTIDGLTSPGLVLANGTETISPAANSTSFSMPTPVATGKTYNVTIKTQPSGQSCLLSNGSGTVGTAAISTVNVSCPSPWVWVSGSSAANAAGVYGMRGVAAAGNVPGARFAVTTWTDAAGNLWLFGGTEGNGYLNDLWKFTPSTGLWTWVGGANTPNVAGVYGTLGVASATNVPGSREGAASWTDGNGIFWLFGGYGFGSTGGAGSLNDLWRYSPSAGTWTWVNGPNSVDSLGVLGTQGVAAPANVPPARSNATSVVSPAGEFWLFGGFIDQSITNATTATAVDDLWKYSPATGLWTWVSGSPNGFNPAPVYGTRGVAAAGNDPGARNGASGWSDANGNVWVFGGGPATQIGLSIYNSLFRFDPSTNLWTWVSGSTTANVYGIYGSEGTPASGNVPGSRLNAASWTDASGNFWLFGGDGTPPNPDLAPVQLNDVWMYNLGTGLWTWVSGANTDVTTPPGVYGTQGVAAPGNVPAARGQAAAWIDASGHIWIFGGEQYYGIFFNDLWTFGR
jgi:N-acetylneuraminic acid mutarotase